MASLKKAVLISSLAVIMLFLSAYLWCNALIIVKLFYHGLISLFVPILHISLSQPDKRKAFKKVGFRIISPKKTIIWGVSSSLGVAALVILGYLLFHDFLLQGEAMREVLHSVNLGGTKILITIGFWILLVNPLLEEFFWRGYVQSFLLFKYRPALGIGVPSFFFGLAHLPLLLIMFPLLVSVIIAVGIGGVGAFWGWLRNRTGTLIPGMISHALGADLSIALLGYFFVISPAIF